MDGCGIVYAICEVHLLKPEQGGKSWPIQAGYRPAISLAGAREFFSAQFQFEGKIDLGTLAFVKILFQGPVDFLENLKAEKIFLINEGPKIVGDGRIVEVLSEAIQS